MPKLGIIAEDETDADALRVIAQRIVPRLATKKRVGNGCSKILVKTAKWLPELRRDGCTHFALVHDLDRDKDRNQLRSESALRASLQSKIPDGFDPLICIPVEELEAWFWADAALLTDLARKPTSAQVPHTVASPKEALEKLSRDGGKKPRYSTNDNAKLAAKLDLTVARKACRSLEAFCAFVEQLQAPA